VGGLFLVNGATYNSLVPRLPAVRDELGLSNAALGAAIAAFPAAAIAFGVLAGPLIARFGSGRVAVGVGMAGAVLLPTVALAPTWAALAGVLFVLGLTDAWADAAMNAHGLRVQARYGRSIINGLHAVWSVAAVAAGFVGAAAAGLGIPLLAHLGVVALVLVAVSAAAARGVLPGPEPAAADQPTGAARRTLWAAAGPLLAIAALLVASGGIEDSAASWGALYVRDDLGAGPFLAGLPFVAFQAAMTVGRLAGDRVVDRIGAVRVARGGALLAAAGMGSALLLAHPVAAVAGFAVAGLGVSTLFPLAFAAAGAIPGVRPGDGIAVVGWLARLGFLAFPPTIGAIADSASIGTGLVLVPVAGLAAAALAPALRPRVRPVRSGSAPESPSGRG
jgi:MFS family permease